MYLIASHEKRLIANYGESGLIRVLQITLSSEVCIAKELFADGQKGQTDRCYDFATASLRSNVYVEFIIQVLSRALNKVPTGY